MFPSFAKANPRRRRSVRRAGAAAIALGAGLLLPVLTPAALGSEPGPDAFWTLRIFDEQGKPVPGAVLLDARPGPSPAQQSISARSEMSPLIIDQRNKRFDPFVSVTAPQRPVAFPNSDDVRHHVYSFSEGNAFERKLYRANDAAPVIFTTPGVVALGCNIHDNMQAYVLVTAESVAGPSDTRGVLSVAGSGPDAETGTLAIWHPLLNTTGQAIALPFTRSDGGIAVTLPLTWNDPQERRTKGDLEALLRQFSREDP